MIQNILAFIGGLFVLCFLLGVFFDGIAFRFYIGTSEGAKQWHQDNADKPKNHSKVMIK